MLKSMTGFGKGEAGLDNGIIIHAEISSVNRKQLEIRFAMPPEFAALEAEGRKVIGSLISRGAIQVRVTLLNPSGRGQAAVNRALLDTLIAEARSARNRAGLTDQVAVETLMAFPGVIASASIDAENEVCAAAFLQALNNAGAKYDEMRSIEGAALKADLEKRLAQLEAWHAELKNLVAGQPAAAKERLLAKIQAEKLPVDPQDPALLKEILFYVDKGDVTEELTRLSSHFAQFHRFLEQTEPAGRSLDFLAQEIFREITTLGNKAALPGVSPIVVAFKAEMEKIREQIQNIE